MINSKLNLKASISSSELAKMTGLILTIGLSFGLFAPYVYMMLIHPSDYNVHLRFAYRMVKSGTFNPELPHILFHITTILCAMCFPSGLCLNSIWISAGIVAVMFYGMISAGNYFVLVENATQYKVFNNTVLNIIYALSVMFVAPIFIFSLASNNTYWGYITPNPGNTPTYVTLAAVSIPLAWIISRYLGTSRHMTKQAVIWISLLTVLSGFAKPNYILCMVPALAIMVASRILRGEWKLLPLITAVGIPAIVLLILQYVFTFHSGKNSIVWAPLQVVTHYSGHLIFKLLMSILFPLVVVSLFYEQVKKDAFLNLSWLCFGFGIMSFYLLGESAHMEAGNFIWGADITLLILFLASLRFLCNLSDTRICRLKAKKSICYVIYSIHVACGIISYAFFLIKNSN